MGAFCIGSYTRVLLSGAIKGEGQASFCPRLFGMLVPHAFETLTEDSIGQILGGAQNLNSDWINTARDLQKTPRKAERYFYQYVRPYLEPQKYSQVILALKTVIDTDEMSDGIELGSISHMTKRNFLDWDIFPYSEVLTDLFLYAVIHTENTDQKKFVRSISKKYCDQFNDRKEEIKTYETESVIPLDSIKLSLRGKSFERTFTKVYESSIGLPKPNHVQIYRVGLDETRFVYDQMQGFVENSIGYYVLSRARVQELLSEEEEARIFPEAIKFLKERYVSCPDEIHKALSGLMTYSFLEIGLKAPKLLNSMELQQPGFLTDSVHLLKLDGITEPVFQVVYGTSHMVGNLREAIDCAFEHVSRMKANRKKEHRLIDPSALRQACTSEEAKMVKQILFPNKSSVDSPMNMDSYGIFLGYTIDLPDGAIMTEDEFRDAVADQMRKDIDDNIDYINERIASLNLSAHSFYVYVLPFNDVVSDHKEIMGNLLEMKGGAV